MPKLHLVSHEICPYVQRAVITLLEKNAPFERTGIDLANPPEWFKKISPLGKVPLLQVDGEVIFESAVICEYLDETIEPRLHPSDPLARARHRAWIEFGSALLVTLWEFNTAPDPETLEAKRKELQAKFETVEQALGAGPYFGGAQFSLVDATYAPIFRYFDVYDGIVDFGVFAATPKVRAWREALAVRPSVKNAVAGDYPEKLMRFIQGRNGALARRIAAAS
jgi:glutathione S-transferase